MGQNTTGILGWPPLGWTQLAAIRQFEGQAVEKDIARARIYGLQYKIDAIPLRHDDVPAYRYELLIDGWEYSILNESTEYPVLSFSFADRPDPSLSLAHALCDIRVFGRPVPGTPKSCGRALGAALFFLRHIQKDAVPDINRVLRSYKLHPNQHFLYRDDDGLGFDLKSVFTSGFGRMPPSGA